MTDCPYCRKPIDPLATRCPHCRGEVQLRPLIGDEPTVYTTIVAPTLGAGLMSLVFCLLSPFSGLALHFALGAATNLSIAHYMVGFDTLVAVALIAMALAALCGWLRTRIESLALSLLSFATPFLAPPILVIAFQIADIGA